MHYTQNLSESKLTAAQVDACLDVLSRAVAKEEPRARLTEIVASLGLPKQYKWDALKIVCDGSSAANILSVITESGDEVSAIHGSYSQGIGLTKFDQSQVSVFRGPGQHLYLPKAIRYVPQGAELRLDSVRNGFLRLSQVSSNGAGKEEILVFEDNGLLRSFDRRSALDNTFYAIRQFEPAGYSGGVVFPRLSSKFNGTGTIVTEVEIVVIKQADFNVPIDAKEFQVPFQAGTVFADHRNDREQFAPASKTWKANVGGSDALDAADHPAKYHTTHAGTPVSGSDAGRRWRWVIAANLVALGLVYVGVRMRRRSASRAAHMQHL